jgi:two-component system, OmpR family, response regulator MtrA
MAIDVAHADRRQIFSAGFARWPYRILAVEATTNPISDIGIELVTFPDGASALMCLSAEDPAVVLAPTEIPGVDFHSFVEAILEFSTVPVIVGLTSGQGSSERAAEALRRGAHGLIALPAGLDQLGALTKRIAPPRSAFSAPRTFGSISMDPQAYSVDVGGVPVNLSLMEFAVLTRLMLAAPAVVTKEELMEVEVGNGQLTHNHLKSVISRLRAKLSDAAPDQSDVIETVRAVGYRLRS